MVGRALPIVGPWFPHLQGKKARTSVSRVAHTTNVPWVEPCHEQVFPGYRVPQGKRGVGGAVG